jgi:23S rRNA pseudouridine2457 synthase
LGELYNFPEGTMGIGRLDENSEGLLLLTTDGK